MLKWCLGSVEVSKCPGQKIYLLKCDTVNRCPSHRMSCWCPTNVSVRHGQVTRHSEEMFMLQSQKVHTCTQTEHPFFKCVTGTYPFLFFLVRNRYYPRVANKYRVRVQFSIQEGFHFWSTHVL